MGRLFLVKFMAYFTLVPVVLYTWSYLQRAIMIYWLYSEGKCQNVIAANSLVDQYHIQFTPHDHVCVIGPMPDK